MDDLVNLARSMRSSGVDLEAILAEVRVRGATIIDCVKIVREIEHVNLGQAKRIVDASSTWADMNPSNHQLRNEIGADWSHLDE